jgi:site-specific DNA-cytosine methylase
MRLLSICTGMGLMDRAYLDACYDVVPGCEIDPDKRAMYLALCGGEPLVHDLADLPAAVRGEHFDGIIGGPSCQSHSKLKAIRTPKFPDLTPLVLKLLDAVSHGWFKFENVVPIAIPGAQHTRCNAMHFYQPHQSRVRWFTHSPDLTPPKPRFRGDVDELMAYSVVAGRIYGPKRGAKLQGYPAAAALPFRCTTLQHGLADAVPYPLALAWAETIRGQMSRREQVARDIADTMGWIA